MEDASDTFAVALEKLSRSLLLAKEEYVKNQDGGRFGAARALNAVIEFCGSFNVELNEQKQQLEIPFLGMLSALSNLDEGIVLPLVKPKKREKGGRAPESSTRKYLRGACSAILKNLIDKGMDEKKAAKEIASYLKKAGLKKHGGGGTRFEATTIIKWKEKTDEEMSNSDAKVAEKIFRVDINLPQNKILFDMSLQEFKNRQFAVLLEHISHLRSADE